MKLSEADVTRIAAAVTERIPQPEPEEWLERMVRRRVRVHTKTDQTYEGLLREAAPDGVVLWSAQLVDKPPVTLAGEVFIPRSEVQMVQFVRM